MCAGLWQILPKADTAAKLSPLPVARSSRWTGLKGEGCWAYQWKAGLGRCAIAGTKNKWEGGSERKIIRCCAG